MALQLIEDAKGDIRNAQTLALASDLAYLAEAEGVEGFRSQLGLEARLFSVGNTQAYVATNDEHIVVAFRGTESPTTMDGLKDCLLSDACNLLIVPEGDLGTDFVAAGVGARFHMGFIKALADIWEPVSETVTTERKKNDRPLWITGHSLGGALALLAAWRFKRKFVPVHQVYTFGAPMIGNDLAAQAFDRELPDGVFRYVNSPDPVPMLPTISLIANHYCHCGRELVVGTVVAAESAGAFLKQMAGKTVDGVLQGTLIDDVWNGLHGRLSAHFLDNYKKLIGERLSEG
jgi:predicted lipase